MRRALHALAGARTQAGQAMFEYLVVASVLVTALFVFQFNGQSLAQYAAEMIRRFFQSLTFFFSLP